jgi:TRAP-type uncharacterized transport system substrate-binding protein
MAIQDVISAFRSRLVVGMIAVVVLAVAALWAVVALLRPMPPRTVVMATGPEGSAYHEMGMRYRDLLARSGITVQLLPTAGTLENLARLRDPRSEVRISFLFGGLTSEVESPGIESLGAVFYEPLWLFYLREYRGRGLEALRGRKISIGPDGSGTRALSLEVLARNGVDRNFAELLPYAHQAAGDKLLSGEIAAAFMLTSWEAPVVRKLLASERVELMSFPRTDAYVALFPYLNKLVVPAGVGDLAKNRPPTDVFLFAPKASLVIRSDLHPAIQYLLLEAAVQINSRPGIFQKAGQFPAAESIDLPLSSEARQFYKSGQPFLQRHLPFWLAVLADHLLVLLIPVVGVIYPLIRFLPALYEMEMRRRIFRLYGELKTIEQETETRDAENHIADLVGQLDRLEGNVNRLRVPVYYADMLYTLRTHIDLVRERFKRPEGTPTAS